MTHRLILCQSCPNSMTDFSHQFNVLPFEVTVTECLSGCTRPATLAFRAPGKTAYLFGDLTEADLPDLLTFARAYRASPDGNFADARPFGTLRHKAMARIPG